MVEQIIRNVPLRGNLIGVEEQKQGNTNVNMVFLGIKSSGKSTLMQAIQDFVLEKDYNQRTEMIRTQEIGQSETQKIEEHQIKGPKWSVTIIDTPGLADTRGPEWDNEIMQDIAKKISKFGKFHAFCFAMKADEYRETQELQQTYKTLKYLLPEKLENFFLCLTRSSIPLMSKVMEQIVDNLGLSRNNIFFFDNRAYEKTLNDKSTKIRELKYKNSQKAILNFLNTASQLSPQESQVRKYLIKKEKENTFFSTIKLLFFGENEDYFHFSLKDDSNMNDSLNDQDAMQEDMASDPDIVQGSLDKQNLSKCHICNMYRTSSDQSNGSQGNKMIVKSNLKCHCSEIFHILSQQKSQNKQDDKLEIVDKVIKDCFQILNPQIGSNNGNLQQQQSHINKLSKQIGEMSEEQREFIQKHFQNVALKKKQEQKLIPK